jgi:hypothetical protein
MGAVKGTNLICGDFGDPIGVGFKIVDEEDVLDSEGPRQIVRIDAPGKISELDAESANRSGKTETGGDDLSLCADIVGKKLVDDSVERSELAGGELLGPNAAELAAFEVIQREVDFGAAYVTSKDHLFQLQRTCGL